MLYTYCFLAVQLNLKIVVQHSYLIMDILSLFRDYQRLPLLLQGNCYLNRSKNYSMEWVSYDDPEDIFRIRVKKPELRDMWLGISHETFDYFMAWLKAVAPEEYYNKIKTDKSQRLREKPRNR